MRTPILLTTFASLAALLGCGGGTKQQDFPDLHPVKGVIKRDGKAVTGGVVMFTADPAKPDFQINSEVGTDGTYSLSTFRTNDKAGERKQGAPPGSYKVTYTPPLTDQAAGGSTNPIELPKAVTVKTGENDIPIDVPKK
jgi:hypothetical protein